MAKLYDPENGQMRIAGLMSGSGTNLRKIIEFEKQSKAEIGKAPYHVAVIFTDNFGSNATVIGSEYDIPVVMRDIKAFYAARGRPLRDLEVRAEFDAETVRALSPFEVNVAAYAGYMSIATKPLINAFLGVNVHPADLSVLDGNKRRYTGDKAVRDAILAGETELRSSTHIVEERVDYGRVLMISPPLEVRLGADFNPHDKGLLNKVADEHQDRLKQAGDWIIFPKTLMYIAEGRYSADASENLHFGRAPIPNGLRLKN